MASSPSTLPVILKIQKLLALANQDAKSNGDENEASAAMDKVQELLAQYNLSLAEVSQAQGASKPADDVRVKETYKRGAMYKYQGALWGMIAHCNFCWHWLSPVMKNGRKVNNHHYFVGREANVIVVKIMGDYLESTINRLCPWQGKDCISRSAISWKEGCAARLQSRLLARKTDLEQKSDLAHHQNGTQTTALALRDVAQAEYEKNYDAMYGEGAYARSQERSRLREEARKTEVTVVEKPKPETEAQRRKREAKQARDEARYQRQNDNYWANKDIAAYHHGVKVADTIGLDAQVSATEPKKGLR